MGANESAAGRAESAHAGTRPELGLSWGVGEKQGWRPTMEDAFVAMCLDGHGSWAHTGVFGVFDGHGGPQVAEFCAEHLPHIVMQKDATQANSSLRDAYLQLDEMLVERGRTMQISDPGHPDNVGCTAVLSLISQDTIIVANAGDSRAVLSRKGKAVPLSKDHKPNLPKESARIIKAGGFISEQRYGTRGVTHRVNGKLSLSRSMGDLRFKKNMELEPAEQMVSCVPDVKCVPRQAEDDFMVIACDGVWDVMTSQKVVDRVWKDLPAIRKGSLLPGEVVNNILSECVASDPSTGKGTDNMTMILVLFQPSLRPPALKVPMDLFGSCLQLTPAPMQPALGNTRIHALKNCVSHKVAEKSATILLSSCRPFTVH
jgi:serine/threonine protein phosphatase PrpC